MEAVLLLGGNVGEPGGTFSAAERSLGDRAGRILARSRDHWTEPWGFSDDRLFLNRALLLGTALDGGALMGECLRIERELGRLRPAGGGYGPRTIDIDILFLGDQVIRTESLVVPHPRLHVRYFALAPVADIAPGLIHPILQRTVIDLLNDVIQAS